MATGRTTKFTASVPFRSGELLRSDHEIVVYLEDKY